jgi:hypothetical protein
LDISKLYKIFALCQIVASDKKKIFAGDGFHNGMARVVALAPMALAEVSLTTAALGRVAPLAIS